MNRGEGNKHTAALVTVCILGLLLIACVAVVMFYYYKGIRYDKQSSSLIDISADYSYTVPLALDISEGRFKKEYPIDVTYTYRKTDADTSPFYSIADMEIFTEADKDQLSQAVSVFLSGMQRKGKRGAFITPDLKLVSAYDGNEVDEKSLTDSVLELFPGEASFRVEDYYNVVKDAASERVCDFYDRISGQTIRYTNGMAISLMEVGVRYNPVTGYISVDDRKILEAVKNVTLSYDDVGEKDVDFRTAKSGSIIVHGGTWGTLTDTAAETEYVMEKFHNIHNEQPESNRTPVLRQEMEWDLPDTYIEVDKNLQHVFVYENGRLIMDDDCVTGLPPRRSTPTGVFFITEKCKNRVLRGQGYASFVNRWMRITNSGVGLHDATWRGRFGGEIYKHDGSHGCINLPKAFAYELYDYVLDKKNMCVVVHE